MNFCTCRAVGTAAVAGWRCPFRPVRWIGNNVDNQDWGRGEHSTDLDLTTAEYGEEPRAVFPAMAPRVDPSGMTINPRTVSNLLFDEDEPLLNDRALTSFVFQWGQFVDHDMDLTEDFAPVGVATLPGEDISFSAPTDGTESELPLGTIIRNGAYASNWTTSLSPNRSIRSRPTSTPRTCSDRMRDGQHTWRAGFGGFCSTSDATTNLG